MENLILSGASAVFSVLAAIISVRLGIRQIRQEESGRLIKQALLENHVQELLASTEHAHDKIRELYSKNNEITVCVAEIKTSLQENTRVLRLVESSLTILTKIEERLNGHIEKERGER